MVEIDEELQSTDLAVSFGEASSRFQLSAVVAEFADVLRGSYWARESSLQAVADEACRVQQLLPESSDVADLPTRQHRPPAWRAKPASVSSARPGAASDKRHPLPGERTGVFGCLAEFWLGREGRSLADGQPPLHAGERGGVEEYRHLTWVALEGCVTVSLEGQIDFSLTDQSFEDRQVPLCILGLSNDRLSHGAGGVV